MAGTQWNIDDTKDIEKFIKFFALKSSQIIIGSRLGEKQHTNCKAHIAGTDWFNLSIVEYPEVVAEVKKTLSGEQISGKTSLCVEISLKTVDGDTMILESWKLGRCYSVEQELMPFLLRFNQPFHNAYYGRILVAGMISDECDPAVRVTYTIYNRLGLLLKSLLTVTRVTPAYKISRRQSPDSYLVCYRIYLGEPQLHNLGEGHKNVTVGQVTTPVGTVYLSVSYRTKMTISPQSTGQNKSMMVKSDHFRTDIISKTSNQLNNEFNVSMSDTLKAPAFADSTDLTIDDRLILPETPFSSLIAFRSSPPKTTPFKNDPLRKSTTESASDTESEVDGNGNITSRPPSSNKTITPANVATSKTCCYDSEASRPQSRADSRRSSFSSASNDDFIMVDLKTPFANANESTDLGLFYREVQTAPPLQTFEEAPALTETVCDLESQLRDFELAVPMYEKLVHNLCAADN